MKKKSIFVLLIVLAFAAFAVFAVIKCPTLRSILFKSDGNTAARLERIDRDKGDGKESVFQSDETPLVFPEGFGISVFAQGLGKVRDLKRGPNGSIFAALMDRGQVLVLWDKDGDGRADEDKTILDGLYNPHSIIPVCVNDQCYLYVAETNAVSRYVMDTDDYTLGEKERLFDLPDSGGHYTRTIVITSVDGEDKLLTSIGSSCNVCDESEDERAAVLVSNMDGSNLRVYAKGLRNAVFMAVHPVTKEVWATENGRDWLGDDLPPEEVNIIRDGEDYGWPVCYGTNIHDSNYDKNQYIQNPCTGKTPPHIEMQAHSAPLGIAFFPGVKWPEEYRYNALVAFHGSWNRSVPTGYKVVRMVLDRNGNFIRQEDFITGWLNDKDEVLGRPTGILIDSGEIFISDDEAGAIYRLVYIGETNGTEDTSDIISVATPEVGDWVRSPLKISGKARGTWFFEASFPIELRDANGDTVASGIASAKDDWMTDDFVDFEASLDVPPSVTENGELILKKDNPSDLAEYDMQYKLPIVFASVYTEGDCTVDGDCKLPMSYAIRSCCPFEPGCYEGKCVVRCPEF